MHLRFTGCLKKTLMCFIIQLKYIIQTLSLLDNIKTSHDFCKQAHLTCQQWKSHALSPLVSKNSSGFDSLSSSAHTKRKRQLHSLEHRAVCRVPLFWLHQKKAESPLWWLTAWWRQEGYNASSCEICLEYFLNAWLSTCSKYFMWLC